MPETSPAQALAAIATMVALVTGIGIAGAPANAVAAEPFRAMVEADWLRQALASCGTSPGRPGSVPTWADAAGAVDGVKNGRYAFHTDLEPHPWWQVDLGEQVSIARVVVYNRLDYAPGLHNADHLRVLVSEDGVRFSTCHDTAGKHFGGIRGAAPLDVRFREDAVAGRFLRLQVPSDAPTFFHLDEVEVYGTDDPRRNIALGRAADQSSVSQWSTAKIDHPVGSPERYSTLDVISRARRLSRHLRREGVDTTEHERALDAIEETVVTLGPDAPAELRRSSYTAARSAARRLAFANHRLDFDELLVVKRFTQETYPDVCLNHMPWVSRPGGDLCVVSGVFGDTPTVRPILNGALGPGHVHGVDLWYDGTKVVFGYAKAKTDEPPEGWLDRRASYDLRRNEEPIHIYEIAIDGTGLRQLTGGEWSDLDPTYLPNGDIAFVSERCGYSLQCNEYDKDETSTNLYVIDGDGMEIRRLSVTKDGDYLPHVLDDGTIGYTRWEYQERSFAHIQSIWTVRPDGTWADALFKQHMNDPWALEDVRSAPESRKLVAVATGHHTLAAGPLVVIDPSVGMNEPWGIGIVTPGVAPPEGGMAGQTVPEGGVRDAGGFYMTPWALSDKTFLASYSYGCAQTDPAGYAIYLVDVFGTKELLYRDPSISCFTPIPLRARERPPVVASQLEHAEKTAVCAVGDVGYGVEGIDPGSIRYIRISQRVPWPYDNRHGGWRYAEKAHPNNWTPARVLGEVPVEIDGSAHFRVPVDEPVYFQLLDANRMELRRMRSFISFHPGEVRGCVGCHESRAEAPSVSGVPLAMRREPSIPTAPPWGDRPISFLRDVQPLLDRRCAGCHGGLDPAGGVDLSGGLTARHNRAFDTIIERKLVSWSNVMGDANVTPALAFGSHRSRLVSVIGTEPDHEDVRLSAEEHYRLVTWIDANAPYHDRCIDKRPARPPYDLAADGELRNALSAIHERRCRGCHEPEAVSRLDWIDLHDARQSRFLSGPLSEAGGGRGTCSQAVYRDRRDADYRAALRLVAEAVRRAWDEPRRDVASLRRPRAPAGARRPGLRGRSTAERRDGASCRTQFEFRHFPARLGAPGSSSSRRGDDSIPEVYHGGAATKKSAILALPEGPSGVFGWATVLAPPRKVRSIPANGGSSPASPPENGETRTQASEIDTQSIESAVGSSPSFVNGGGSASPPL